MLASRGFNIDSMAAGETERNDTTRITFVIVGDDVVIDQIRKQLDRIPYVIQVDDISKENFVERELMLIKVTCPPEKRAEIAVLAETFRGHLVDVQADNVMIEVSGSVWKVKAFIDLMRPFRIMEVARAGLIALVRGQPPEQSDIVKDQEDGSNETI